jgi:hypothetical protein
MGEAIDRHGDVLGTATGATRAEVLEKLEAAHPDAREVRIRTADDRPSVDRAYEARVANAGPVTPATPGNGEARTTGNGDARTQAIPTGAGNAGQAYDPVADILSRFRRLDQGQQLTLSKQLAIDTATRAIGRGPAQELARELDAFERSIRAAGREETNGRERLSAKRTYHERHGLIGHEPEEIGLDNVEELFRYQGWNDDQTQRGDMVRELLVAAARGILRNVPLGPSRDIALRNLMIVRMVCNQAITFNGRF